MSIALTLAAGCMSQPQDEGTRRLDVGATIDYYTLAGYTGPAGEGFYAIAGKTADAKQSLREIVVNRTPARSQFNEGETLNLVVFRGVFSTGGFSISIDRVERTGGTFTVYANYTDPGRGTIVTEAFTSPAAFISIGSLPKGSYQAILKVTSAVNEGGRISIKDGGTEHANIAFTVS
ncbi:MAG TPA: protease complex subunit PrcB family protein [Candidatus Methanoperedenaceae archaeon]|nr:protease complex subunit PrcB family protein [Candidatus Methanoperedenaceae archaeon]